MPQAVAGAAAWGALWWGTTAATIAYGAAYLATVIVINYGLSKIAQSLNGKRRGEVGGGTSREFTVRGTVEPMQMIYGQVKTAGFIAFVATSGADSRFLHFAVAWAAHQCEELSDHWLDSRKILAAEINAGGDVTTAEFQDGGYRLLVRRFLGTHAQSADTELTTPFAGTWTSNHRGRGVCYTHFRLDRTEKAFPQGAPQSFFALAKGRRLYDPRKDSTNGGSGLHRYGDATTWEWSQNPPLARRDYTSGGSRWYDQATPEPRLGFGAPNARIDDAYVIAAANIADEDVTIPPASPTTTQKRYTCDIQLSCADTHLENLRKLESCDVGHTSYVNGKYRISSGSYDAPTITIEEDDIQGPITCSTHPNKEDLYNYITGVFFDEERDWQLCPFPNITNSSFETADSGQRKRPIELLGTRSSYRAQRIGILHLAHSRHKEAIRFERLSPKALSIAEHDTFMVNCAEYGYDETVFRCIDWELLPDCFVAITAKVETSASYNDPAVGDYAAPGTATVPTPSYDQPIAPTNLTATGFVKGVLLKWLAPAPSNTRQIYHVYQHTANTPFSSATRVWSGNTLHTTIDLAAGVTRFFWVTAELNGIETSSVPSGNGVSGTPSPAATEDIEEGAAFASFVSTGGGGAISTTEQVLMSISVPAQPVDTTVVVTFSSNMFTQAVEFGGAGIWAYINNVSLGLGYDNTQANARAYAPNAASSQVNSVAFEETFALPASTARTYNVYGFRSGGGASASGSFSSGVVKAEVMLR